MILSKIKYLFILLIGLLFFCSQAKDDAQSQSKLQSASWPVFRGNTELSGIATDAVPSKISLKWTFETTSDIVSTPVIENGRVFIGSTDGFIYAMHIEDGSEIWKYDTKDEVEASAMILDSTLFVGTLSGDFIALDAETGNLKWKQTVGSGIYGSANWAEGDEPGEKLILVGSYDNHVYCYDSKSGALRWRVETDNYINGAPSTDGEVLIFGGCDEILHQVRVQDGKRIGGTDVGSYIPGSPAISGGHAFVGHYGAALVCVSLDSQNVVWTYEPKEGDAFFSSPAVTEDVIVVGSRDEKLHCLDRKTGVPLWTFRARDSIDSSPVIVKNDVFVGSDDGRLYRIDIKTGKELWSYEIGAAITGSPAVAGGMVFITAQDGIVYAFGG